MDCSAVYMYQLLEVFYRVPFDFVSLHDDVTLFVDD